MQNKNGRAVPAATGMDASQLVPLDKWLRKLDDDNDAVRCEAVDGAVDIWKLGEAVQAAHAGAVAARLRDTGSEVRFAAVEALAQLVPSVFATHVGAVLDRLEDEDCEVRWAALEAFQRMRPALQAEHAARLAPRFGDEDPENRQLALEIVRFISEDVLEENADVMYGPLAVCLSDQSDCGPFTDNAKIRKAAWHVVDGLSEATRMRHFRLGPRDETPDEKLIRRCGAWAMAVRARDTDMAGASRSFREG